MKFKRLYTNKNIFDIKFKNGLNIIYSKVKSNKTEHGSGKTTFFKLIDFCLMAEIDKKFETEKFQDIELILEIEFDKYPNFKIKRGFKENEVAYLSFDGTEFIKSNLVEAKIELRELFFNLKRDDASYFTFRKLLPFLFRFEDDYRDSFMRNYMFNQNAQKNLLNLFFIGLDESKINEKLDLMKQREDIEKIITGLKIYIKDNEIDNLTSLKPQKILLEEEIRKREQKLKNFKVLEEYREIELEANKLTKYMEQLNNKLYAETELLKEYELAFEKDINFEIKELEEFYNSIKINLGDNIKHSFYEVVNFNNTLIKNRNDFIADEINRLKKLIDEYTKEFRELEKNRSHNLILLRNFGALDEHNRLISNLEDKKNELRDIEILIEKREEITKYSEKKKRLDNKIDIINKKIEKEFKDNDSKIKKLVILFNQTFERIIKTKGYLTIDTQEVKRNESDNIILKITSEKSTSDGVEKAKVFSYDFSLMELENFKSRKSNFLFHDGIANHIHKEHINEIFKMVNEKAEKYDFQYFISLNSDKILDYEENKSNIIMELSDEKNLMGFDF